LKLKANKNSDILFDPYFILQYSMEDSKLLRTFESIKNGYTAFHIFMVFSSSNERSHLTF